MIFDWSAWTEELKKNYKKQNYVVNENHKILV